MPNEPLGPTRWILALALLGCLLAASAAAESRQQMRSLDEQVQEIKSDVLSIAAELARLEERLIYPSSTQVALFVSLADGADLRLDSVEVRIDGEPVARHIYTFKELEALRKGGVQRLYTGNLPTGEHRLEVGIAGKRGDGSDLARTEIFEFEKGVGPKLVGIELAADAGIQLGSW